MNKELILKKCSKCGALIKIIKACSCEDCGLKCCGEEMITLKPNSIDASVEKHLPNIQDYGETFKVTVNHVMENDHYIEWVAYISADEEEFHYFKPGEEVAVEFPYRANSKVYAYCNKHELWGKEIDGIGEING